MVATIIIASSIALYLAAFLFFEIRRRKKGKKSFFTEEYCACSSLNSKRLIAAYKRQKRMEMKKGAKQ
ncbi:MAG: hypothetical protein II721_02555 [Bacilli bacterium]|nr:hypothetical protein [Bacilli bacterium]